MRPNDKRTPGMVRRPSTGTRPVPAAPPRLHCMPPRNTRPPTVTELLRSSLCFETPNQFVIMSGRNVHTLNQYNIGSLIRASSRPRTNLGISGNGSNSIRYMRSVYRDTATRVGVCSLPPHPEGNCISPHHNPHHCGCSGCYCHRILTLINSVSVFLCVHSKQSAFIFINR